MAERSSRRSRRRKIPEPERLKAWVRAGGRCVICNRYLLEGDLSYRELTFGELAHIIGQQNTAGSPRGLDDLAVDERDNADNILLVCDDEHDEFDKAGARDLFSVDLLRQLKKSHEERIHHVTGFAEDRRTTILRMIGNLRGKAVEVHRDAAAIAVIRSAERFPRFSLAYDRHSIEIDLRHVPGEASGGPDYYTSATAIIDEVITHKLRDGVALEEIRHLSVFAFARLPLLVYLGSKLDDNVPIDIYQRHRSTEAWEWPERSNDVAFHLSLSEPAPHTADGVLVMNISGSIQADEIPANFAQLPQFALSVDHETPSPDVLSSRSALDSFTTTCRQFLAEIEANHKQLRLLHVFAAMPLAGRRRARSSTRPRSTPISPCL
jgi:hypothetical protein